MFLLFLTHLLVLFVGFIFGYVADKPQVKALRKKLPRLPSVKVGPVRRPTGEEIRKRGTEDEAEEKEMTALLKDQFQDLTT